MADFDAASGRPLPVDPVELVAIDLDGTLLRSDGSICVQAAKAIHEAVELGVQVVLATGRAPRGAARVYEALELSTVLISDNGALIEEPRTKQVLQHVPLPGELARQVIQIARDVEPGIAVAVEVNDRCFTDSVGSKRLREAPQQVRANGPSDAHGVAVAVNDHIAGVPEKMDIVGPFAKLLEQPVNKVLMVGDPALLGGIQLALHKQMAGKVAFACSHMRLLQVVHAEADKAVALARVAEHYGIGRERVMAIGDAPNDLPMIQWAGLGVAVRNAWDEVRRAAHFIVPSNDNAGVAEALRKYVLTR